MPGVDLHIGGQDRLEPTVSKGTLLLGAEALVWIGATCIRGSAAALRALADALVEAADMAEAYDADPEAWNQREQAERETDR